MVEVTDETRLLVTAMKRLKSFELVECIDPYKPETRPYAKQQEVLNAIVDTPIRAVVAANQTGKSQLGAREVSWIFERSHPFYPLPDRPLKSIVVGRVGEQIESELWANKIKPFLTPGTYKEVRIGNMLQRVEHLENGNVIIFMSHHNVNEAREKIQSYVADFVWIDEMPGALSLILEAMIRILANSGRLLLTFTPLIRNFAIKKWVETLDSRIGKKFNFHIFDNPIYQDRKDLVDAMFANYPENERKARMLGEWFTSDKLVYAFDELLHVEDPPGYHPGWRHVEVIDPAASGKAGFMLLAESPSTGHWYVVRAEYLKGAAASDLLPNVVKLTTGLNITKKISDPHEVWFIKEAIKAPWQRNYVGVYDKARRKNELIKNSQERLLDNTIRVASWCVDLKDEFNTCQWSETVQDKIQSGTRFHLIDCLQYAVDNLPKRELVQSPTTHHQILKQANQNRLKKEATRAKFGKYRPGRMWARDGKRVRVG